MTDVAHRSVIELVGDEPDDTRHRLLAAAVEVVTERGFDRAAVAEIARRAGFTTGAIYSRWPGRRELLVDAVDLVMASHLRAVLSGGQRSAPDVIATLGARLVADEPGEAARRGLVIEAFTAARHDDELAALLRRRMGEHSSLLADVVDDGREAGLIAPDLDTDAVVTMCHAVSLGFVLLRAIDRPTPGADGWNDLLDRLITATAPTAATPDRVAETEESP